MFIQNISAKLADSAADTTGFWNDLYTKRYTSDKIPSRCPLDASPNDASTGRSMVEMLGVLAIIGVLSVGAIAGYSKAMMKYKLNKHMESFNMLLNEAIKLRTDLERQYGKKTNGLHELDSFFHKANLLPDGMVYNPQDDYIYDIFKNHLRISYAQTTAINDDTGVTSHPTIYYMNISMNRSGTKISSPDNEICRNIFLACKENSQNIASVEMRSHITGDYTASALWGNELSNASLKQINDACSSCNSEIGCEIILYISIEYE